MHAIIAKDLSKQYRIGEKQHGAMLRDVRSDGFEIPLLSPGAGFVDLEIASLNLMPGRYSLSFWIQRYGDPGPIDLLEHCIVLAVHTREAGEGRTLERRAGLVFFSSEWELYR